MLYWTELSTITRFPRLLCVLILFGTSQIHFLTSHAVLASAEAMLSDYANTLDAKNTKNLKETWNMLHNNI